MANGTNEDQQLDEFGFPIPSEEELFAERQRIENERKKAATAIQLSGAASALEGALPSALPTQTAPLTPPAGFEPALMAEQERLNQVAAARAKIPGIGVRTDIPAAPDTQGRMYMGPNIGAAELARIPEGGRISLMPPAVTPPASRLEQLQALDRPGSRTIGIREEPPYSDASLAASQNRMKYEAIQKFMAGDRSPAIVMAAIGGTGGQSGRGLASLYRQPQEDKIYHVGNRMVRVNLATGETTDITPSTIQQKRVIPDGVKMRYAELLKAERDSSKDVDTNDPNAVRSANRARWDREQYEASHPELTGIEATAQSAPVSVERPKASKGKLNKGQAASFLKQAGGNKAEARRLAIAAGYEL